VERELTVHIETSTGTALLGRLWTRIRGARETASFEYDKSWLARPDHYGIDPELPPTRGRFHTDRPLFNAFADPSPDRWGQTLLRRNERVHARHQKRAPRTLLAVDFLTLVDDATRLGALRLQEPGATDFLASTGKRVPPLEDLSRLLRATNRFVADEETDDDLQLLLAPGTSLGGARPKASVRDNGGHLLVAKFPRQDDEWPITRWEATTLALADAAGIDVPTWRLELVQRRPVLTLRRFDRRRAERVHFMSAMTALSASDNETHSYLELVDAIRRGGSEVDTDLRQLWRRVVFSILVSNTDDHLRNHGLLRDEKGWRLAPAYDMNPVPVDVRPRVHALAIDEDDPTSSLETALAVAPRFGIARAAEARSVAKSVGKVTAQWRKFAAKHGLKTGEIERMESAFEHDDLRRSRGEA
jgi:serine/threonine-protein kinase HipA